MTLIAEHTVVWLVFIATYLGMAMGRVPGLSIDRTGITLTGLIVLLMAGIPPIEQLAGALNLPTLLMLFALMLIASHFELARGFDWIAAHIVACDISPLRLLALVVAAGGLLSAVLVNDIVVFAFTPMLCKGLYQRGLDPRPYLLGLAGAANAGSAATLIGNPQNILIGQVGGLGFFDYSCIALIPALAALAIVFAIVAWVWRDALRQGRTVQAIRPPAFDTWFGGKSLLAIVVLIALLASVESRAVAALGVAGMLLWNRRLSTRALLGNIDGPLLVMIGSLFVITGAVTALPELTQATSWLERQGLMPVTLESLVAFSLLASNTIGNVPAVVLLLEAMPTIPESVLYGLALFSTLSGNLLLTGSLANIIVAERGAQCDVQVGFMDFARVGIPITLSSMGIAALWLWYWGVVPPT